jgi:RND family efflux transporter MFP subunit
MIRGFRLLALPVALLATGCGDKEPPQREEVARPVKTLVVGGGATAGISLPGRVEASNRVDLSFRVKGPLIELNVKRGQSVDKGYLIARVDPRDYQIALEEAKAAFTKAEADFKRYQSLYEKNAVSLAELDQRRSQRDVAKARMDDAEANLSYTYLRAPFAGTISERFVENFEEVAAQQPVVSLENFEMLDIIVDIPEHLIASVREGGERFELTASFDAAPDRTYPLTVKEVATQADPSTRTYQVRLSMEQPEEINVLTGMSANVRGTADVEDVDGERSAHVVPSASVFQDEDGNACVWVIDDSLTARKRQVRVGEPTGEGNLIIEAGLSSGDRVATAAVAHLREGMKVRLLTD